MTELTPPRPATSMALRTPGDVAAALRTVAGMFADRAGQDISMTAAGSAAFIELLSTWADVLDRAPRPRGYDPSDAWPVSEALLQLAERWHAENSLTDGLFLDFGEAQGAVAALRKLAERAAELQLRASGFHFDPSAAPRPPAPHPDDVVPGLTTGTGEHVTYELLARLNARRAGGGRPCDTDARAARELTAKRPSAASQVSTALPCDTDARAARELTAKRPEAASQVGTALPCDTEDRR